MISCVSLTGYLSDIVDGKFRLLKIERTPIREREVITDAIPIAYWNPSPNSKMFNLKSGTLVMITGRLERDEKIGIYILCERLEFISANEGETKITIL